MVKTTYKLGHRELQSSLDCCLPACGLSPVGASSEGCDLAHGENRGNGAVGFLRSSFLCADVYCAEKTFLSCPGSPRQACVVSRAFCGGSWAQAQGWAEARGTQELAFAVLRYKWTLCPLRSQSQKHATQHSQQRETFQCSFCPPHPLKQRPRKEFISTV